MNAEEITDQELESFKNFDALLQKHHKLQSKRVGKWRAMAGIFVIVVAGMYFLLPDPAEDKFMGDVVKGKSSSDVSPILKSEKAEQDSTNEITDATADKNKSTQHEVHTKVKPTSVQKIDQSPVNQPAKKSENVLPSSTATKQAIYIQAEPTEGYEALYAYFRNELVYPQEAVKDSIEGVLTVAFVVNKQGKPESITISGSLGKAFEAESIRLIKNMPLWKPATLNGQPVDSKLSIPLTFQLQQK